MRLVINNKQPIIGETILGFFPDYPIGHSLRIRFVDWGGRSDEKMAAFITITDLENHFLSQNPVKLNAANESSEA